MIEFTDDQRVEMIENQCEHIFELAGTYTEMGTEEDKENVRALYEEYAEWLDTYTCVEGAPEEYITAWAPNLLGSAG
tara:strand:+ start:48 stop:278 length:231 start_codon:yes stop_codon:yes gene_type:complete